MERHFFNPLISPHNIPRPVPWIRQFGRRAPVQVEIGFGLGEFLVRSALEHARSDFVGIEQNWERIGKTLTRIAAARAAGSFGPAPNIRLVRIDARVAFERLFHPRSVDHIVCLFPCPWPKRGHLRHRLFSTAFLKLLNSRLKRHGEIKIVTDFLPYREWILGQIGGTGFEARCRRIAACHGTKFERKWQQKGRQEFYEIILKKIKSVTVAVKKDAPLKAYLLKDFDPGAFRFMNHTGDTSVIFKEMLFDPLKNKAMVHLVVAEDDLTQHFWVAITKKGKGWRVCKADGQNILPTPGIARAIELVYEAGKKQA